MTGLILDLIVVVIIVLLLIFSIWRGAYKMLFGLISSLLALILAIALVSNVTQFVIEKTTIDERISAPIDKAITTKLPNADVMIRFYDIDGDGTAKELGYTADGEVKPFSDLLADSSLKLLSKPIESFISGSLEEGEEVAFATVLVATIVSYIMLIICFIALLIVLSILVHILMNILKKFVQRTYAGHFIDKLLGFVLGVVLSGIIVYGSLAVIKLLGTYEFIIPVNNLINDSKLTKFFFDKNIVYNWLVKSFDIKSFLNTILSKVGIGS